MADFETGLDVHTHEMPDNDTVTIHDIEFQNVVNAVEDLGMDPTGEEPIDDEEFNDTPLQDAIADDTVIFFPPGTYLVTANSNGEWVYSYSAENFAMIGTGESHRDVQFKPPEPGSEYHVPKSERDVYESNRMMDLEDSQNILIENLSFNALDNDVSDLTMWLQVKDNLQIRQVEWMGRIPKEDTGSQLTVDITTESGKGLCEKVAFGTKYGAVIKEYPNTRALTVGTGNDYAAHAGTLRVNRCRFEDLGGSAIRNTVASGNVILENSFFKNCFNAAIRVNSKPGDVVRNCEVIIDNAEEDDIPAGMIRVDGNQEQPDRCTPGGLIENCDLKMASGVNSSGGITNRGFSYVTDLTIRDCRIEYNTDETAPLRVKNDDCGGKWTVENVHVTGSGAVTPVNEKEGVLRDCCFPDRADLSDWDTENVSRGSCDSPSFTLMDHGGFWPSTSDSTQNDTNQDTTNQDTTNGSTVVEAELEKLDPDPKSAVIENTAMGQVGSEADSYSIKGRIKEFKAEDDLTIRVDGEEISNQEFIRRFIRCEPVEQTDGGPSGGNVEGERPMMGFWPHGYYFNGNSETIQDVVDALGKPSIVGNTASGQKQHVAKFFLKRAMPTDQNAWDYMYYAFPLVSGERIQNYSGTKEQRSRKGLQEVVNGELDEKYKQLGQNLKELGISDKTIIRLSPEYNGVGSGGGWAPGSGVGHPELWKNAFEHAVEAIWSTAPEVLIGISPSIHHSLEVVKKGWPSTDHIDYLAVSGIHDGTTPLYVEEDHPDVCDKNNEYPEVSEECAERLWNEAWEYYKTHQFGLNKVAEYSQKYNLPIGFPEWGLKNKQGSASEWMGGDNPRYIRAMWKWMVEHNVHWQTEFEARGKPWHLASGNVPNSKNEWDQTFRKGSETDHIEKYRQTIDFTSRPQL